ncbi:MBL fold metallo-hydrolase [Streptomyces sp. NPDC002088]|uniref:MBL fold metallo-hydrolase n=1 Tax=Streptomyces sp. NPDC002088 TaxID=3154665 RepID=UPI003317D87F
MRPAVFGADPSGERLQRVRGSRNYADGGFVNLLEAPEPPAFRGFLPALLGLVKLWTRPGRRPVTAVPLHPSTLADLAVPPASGLRLTWLGHSTVLAEIGGRKVLFDPVWSTRCSPFPFLGPKRLHPMPVPLESLTGVDVVVISHDHYDHLDMAAIRALAAGDAVFVAPLGVGAHLEHWGVPPGRLRELDWDESADVAGLTLTATPARHSCGRGFPGPQRTLWASWVVAAPAHRVFYTGDTGYFPGFARIGAEHGPFDVTMIQIGAYNELWPANHMTPEEGLRAHVELSGGTREGVVLPVHWGTFDLAPHSWSAPVEGAVAAAHRLGVRIATPRPGAPFEPSREQPDEMWWREAVSKPHAPDAAAAFAPAAEPGSRTAQGSIE